MSTQPSSPTDQWIDWAVNFVSGVSGYPVVKEIQESSFEFATEDQITGDPVHWLNYYVGWMTKYNLASYQWKAVQDTLEAKYKTLFHRRMSELINQKTAITKAEHQAKSEYADIIEAISLAGIRHKKALSDYLTADRQREIVSRSITVRETR